mmetsp:Transcript_8467/g.20724  ORF Transcript_8467/g.20724 Transcript_8467/m.20724 type:complete len:299 (+) Transcript_8467:41-937(+)
MPNPNLMMSSILLTVTASLLITNVQSFTNPRFATSHPIISPRSPIRSDLPSRSQSRRRQQYPPSDALPKSAPPSSSSHLRARPRSKWDDLVDEDDDDDYNGGEASADNRRIIDDVPPDMLHTDANIRRQVDTYDRLESMGGKDVVNDVYARAPGAKEWWLVGKVARISDVSPEQAIERQWPLIERHVWALRLPVRPTAGLRDLSAPFEAWYAPGHTELDAARNDPRVRFVKVSSEVGLSYQSGDVRADFVGFVGKTYDARGGGEPMFYVERNVEDGSCLRGRMVEGDWMLRSELKDDV